MRKTLLPDINVWLALTFDSHVHHRIAKNWFDGLTDEVCYFCRLTQQGFLRLASNRQVFRNQGDHLGRRLGGIRCFQERSASFVRCRALGS